jgi:hypothetical protein
VKLLLLLMLSLLSLLLLESKLVQCVDITISDRAELLSKSSGVPHLSTPRFGHITIVAIAIS